MSVKNLIMLINDEALTVDELFRNKGFSLDKKFYNIHDIRYRGKLTRFLVKTYTHARGKRHAKKEAKILSKIFHIPSVPKILAHGDTKNFYYIIMSRLSGCDLYEYVKDNGNFTEKSTKKIIRKLLTIVDKLHAHKIVHRDIKPENIMYNSGEIWLLDFEGRETEDYRSPELITKKYVTPKTDVWSIGITAYFMVTGGRIPWPSEDEMFDRPLRLDKSISKMGQDFFRCILDKNPQTRYSVKDALNHPWLG